MKKEPSIIASVYGSAAAGLALETSDIDIAISGFPPQTNTKDIMLERMLILGKSLSEKSFAIEVQVIQSASVPVIKTVLDLGKINPEWEGKTNKVDITFEDFLDKKQMHPIHYGVMFTEWVKNKKMELPHFVPIVLLMKKLLSVNGLNIPYYGILLNCNRNRWYEFLCFNIDGCCILKNMSRMSNASAFVCRVSSILFSRF